MVETLQTLGICVGAIALVVIAYSMFILSTAVVMATEDPDIEVDTEDELASAFIREMNRRSRKR
jgi:hypothetical protein